MDSTRQSGILLHVTSLPSPFGIGDLGPSAYRFADFLVEAGQTLWQVLPLVPVGHGYSPYSSPSTFAGSPLLISPERLVADGLLEPGDLLEVPDFPKEWVDFQRVIPYKEALLRRAFERFEAGLSSLAPSDFKAFCRRHADWLDDYALFEAVKAEMGGMEWTAWPRPIASREPSVLARSRKDHATAIRMFRFWQYLFDRQWKDLRAYCNRHGIRIFGDLPIYVAQDSADVWSNPDLFHLDESGQGTAVAGVPPDYFSETGQRWGNPIYRWGVMKRNGYAWWIRRMARILDQVDLVRLDHFRGFEAYWEVPATEETAVKGRWVKGPGAKLFKSMEAELGTLPVVAENLGVITKGVTDLMDRFGFPGMAILQFAFDSGPENEFLPHNYTRSLVAYTGTHDNDTFRGWWTDTRSTQEAAVIERAHQYCRAYLDLGPGEEGEIGWHAIRALMGSVAARVVIPLQDVLGYGGEARMNTPGEESGNWGWRFAEGAVRAAHARRLRHLAELYGRLPVAAG
jgi:4-alpha-glucanotransferase